MGTLITFVTAGQNAITANKLVRRLTLALRAIALLTELEGIAVEAGGACTFVATGEILADGIDSTGRLPTFVALVDITTILGHGVARVSLTAHAYVRSTGVCYTFLADWTRVLIVTLN